MVKRGEVITVECSLCWKEFTYEYRGGKVRTICDKCKALYTYKPMLSHDESAARNGWW